MCVHAGSGVTITPRALYLVNILIIFNFMIINYFLLLIMIKYLMYVCECIIFKKGIKVNIRK